MNNILFKETQKFRQPWIWILLLGMVALFGWGLIQQLILGIPWGSKPASDIVLSLTFLIPAGLVFLFYAAHLDTEIDETGISYKFSPFHFKKYKIDWESVEKAFVRKYSPLGEFGGWGIRYGFNKGKAYNVSGSMGLQLFLKNGKRILIGTQKQSDIESILQQLRDRGIIN
jgi:hypothetical protein